MFRSPFVLPATLLFLTGCALAPPNRVGGIAVSVTPEEYGQRLCGHLELEDYPSCLSAVLDRFAQPRPELPPPGHSTSGPLAVIMDRQVYLGDYRSSPFAASFRVAHGADWCRGEFSAFQGAKDGIFDVVCADGRTGWADLIRDLDGRNGIGRLALADGTRGEIVFGHVPLGTAAPYPYRP